MHNDPHWSDFLDTDAPLKRHFDDLSEISSLILHQFTLYDFTLELVFQCFTPPLRIPHRWKESEPIGVEVVSRGFGCQKFFLNGGSLDTISKLTAKHCQVIGVYPEGDEYVEKEFQGVKIEIQQNDLIILSANLSSLGISTVSPLSELDRDIYLNPNKYA